MTLRVGLHTIHSSGCQILHCKCLTDHNLQGRRNPQRLLSWEEEMWEVIKNEEINDTSSSLDLWVFLTPNHHSAVLSFPTHTFKLSPINPPPQLRFYSGSEHQLVLSLLISKFTSYSGNSPGVILASNTGPLYSWKYGSLNSYSIHHHFACRQDDFPCWGGKCLQQYIMINI